MWLPAGDGVPEGWCSGEVVKPAGVGFSVLLAGPGGNTVEVVERGHLRPCAPHRPAVVERRAVAVARGAPLDEIAARLPKLAAATAVMRLSVRSPPRAPGCAAALRRPARPAPPAPLLVLSGHAASLTPY